VPLSPEKITSVFWRRVMKVEFIQEFPDQFYPYTRCCRRKLRLGGARLTVWRGDNRAVDGRHRIVNKEWLILVAGDEIHEKTVHHVRQIRSQRQILLHTV